MARTELSPVRLPPRLRLPRLLPATILAMALVLVVRFGAVVSAATTAAAAAGPVVQPGAEAPAGKPAPAAPHAQPGAAAGKPEPGHAEPASPAASPEPAVSDGERQLLTDLRQRRLELDRREATLSAREATLAAVDARLAARVSELTALQRQLETLERDRKERDDASWRGLVKMYEAMKAKDAALIFNDLEVPVLLQVMDRMKEAKAAPILAAMIPDRARQLTAELSQMRLKANSPEARDKASPPAGPAAEPFKASPKP